MSLIKKLQDNPLDETIAEVFSEQDGFNLNTIQSLSLPEVSGDKYKAYITLSKKYLKENNLMLAMLSCKRAEKYVQASGSTELSYDCTVRYEQLLLNAKKNLNLNQEAITKGLSRVRDRKKLIGKLYQAEINYEKDNYKEAKELSKYFLDTIKENPVKVEDGILEVAMSIYINSLQLSFSENSQ